MDKRQFNYPTGKQITTISRLEIALKIPEHTYPQTLGEAGRRIRLLSHLVKVRGVKCH